MGEDKLGITSLDIKVDVVGNIAMTTYDMLFYNPTSSILEGELASDSKQKASADKLAEDINLN